MGQNKTKVREWVKWATNKVRSCGSDGFQKGQCGSDGYTKIIRGQMGSKKVRSWESDGLQKGQIMGVRWVTKRSDSGSDGLQKKGSVGPAGSPHPACSNGFEGSGCQYRILQGGILMHSVMELWNKDWNRGTLSLGQRSHFWGCCSLDGWVGWFVFCQLLKNMFFICVFIYVFTSFVCVWSFVSYWAITCNIYLHFRLKVSLPSTLASACTMLRYLYDMSLDAFDRWDIHSLLPLKNFEAILGLRRRKVLQKKKKKVLLLQTDCNMRYGCWVFCFPAPLTSLPHKANTQT